MFRSVIRLFPTFGSRLASTMVARPAAVSSGPIFTQLNLKQNVHFLKPMESTYNRQMVEKIEPVEESSITEMIMTSVLRKRRLKMKKHKLRKRRKAQRALRIKIGK
ncbi:hypothetical protein C6P40_004313 [Pichia californica]|uniref:Ribosomal protein mS38 C-terminal domain-containing protein n=1 Tax=Pichia californica TaxID=460514 RepID=A0A9P6WHU5_9ASCO|nr:hypothetical protein C6P40_004313 [[Candida] californica]